MSKKIFSFILLNIFTISFSQNVNIPDSYFKELLVWINANNYYAKDLNGQYTKIDINGDGEIQVSEAENISYLSTAYEFNLTDITGIEAFKNLTELNIEQTTKLKNLALSNNTKLKKIKGLYNQALESIDIKNCVLLEDLDLLSTKINLINLSQNINLKNLVITGNFNSLDLSKNVLLEKIRIGSDNLTSLNLNNCNKLAQIRIDSDNLNVFNFSILQGLDKVDFINTKITSADFSYSPVSEIYFENPVLNLNSLKLPEQNSNLKFLFISKSSINNIDLTNSLNLESFYFSSDIISNLNFSKNIKLKTVVINNSNLITTINTSYNTNLETFNIFRLPNLTSISIKNGKQQTFGEGFLECPKLSYVCCDESEKAYFEAKNIQTVVTDCLLSTQENTSLIDFKIYPNPSSDYLNFNHKIESIKVFDIQGKLVLNRKINSNNLNVSELKNGVYVLEVFSENKKSSQKFIKK